MRKVTVVAILTFMLLAGCKDGSLLPPRREIDELNIIRVIAVDKCKDPDLIKVTVTSKKEGQAGGGGGGGDSGGSSEQIIVLSLEDKTVLSAVKQFHTYINKQVFWGHTDFYLIGEEAAKEDIVRYLDFLSRDHDFRLDSTVYITSGNAGDFLERSNVPGYFLADYLKSLSNKISLTSTSSKMKILQLMGELDENKTFGIAIPMIKLIGEKARTKGGQNRLLEDIDVDGYGVVKDFKLVDFVHKPDSRGYNFISNNINSGVIQIKDQEGKNIGMDIVGGETKISSKVEAGHLARVEISTKLETNIDEVQTRENILKEDTLHYLEQQESNVIKEEMMKCIQLAQDRNADFLGIGRAVNFKHPILWDKIKDQWNEIFPKLEITVKVESHINRTYDIKEPNGYKAGEKR